jgi:hypothetical protein
MVIAKRNLGFAGPSFLSALMVSPGCRLTIYYYAVRAGGGSANVPHTVKEGSFVHYFEIAL